MGTMKMKVTMVELMKNTRMSNYPLSRAKKEAAGATVASRRRQFVRLPVCAVALLALGTISAVVSPRPAFAAFAAGMGAPTTARAVQGRVVDKQDAPLAGAIVYLKDTRSLAVKSYLSDEKGQFHFGQLADGADYEVWAEQNGQRSSSKSISQFNSKVDIQFTLKIDRAN